MKNSFCSKRLPSIDSTPVPNNYWLNGGLYTYGQDPKQVIQQRWYESRVTPGFTTIPRDKLPINAFVAGTEVYTDDGGSATWNQGGSHRWEGSAKTFFPAMYRVLGAGFRQSDAMHHANDAMQRALSRVNEAKVNLAQAFAERRQTAGLLISSVNRLALVALAFRRGKFSAARRALGKHGALFDGKVPRDFRNRPTRDQFSDLWLEYSYGWRPLINDIYGSAELLAKLHSEPKPFSASGFSRSNSVYSDEVTLHGVTARVEGSALKRARCTIWFDIRDERLAALSSTGLTNPALLAWELLPYSFVIDWIIPVGDYLGKMNATHGLQFRKGVVTTLSTWSGISGHKSNVHGYGINGFKCREDGAIMQRWELKDFPSAEFAPIRYGLNLSQLTSAFALLNQVFRR